MIRDQIQPRDGLDEILVKHGLTGHSKADPYWDEQACYSFSPQEVFQLEKAANSLQATHIEAARRAIKNDLYARMGISNSDLDLARGSLEQGEPSLLSRMDFIYGEDGRFHMIEINAETFGGLIEATAVQKGWESASNESTGMDLDGAIIQRWKEMKIRGNLHFTTLTESVEEYATTRYLMDTARRAGQATEYIDITQIGFDHASKKFVDLSGRQITTLYKHYPWEFMMREGFIDSVKGSGTRYIEPAWKLLTANKRLLSLMWEIEPGHPYLIETHDTPAGMPDCVQKPIYGRCGENITVYLCGKKSQETEGSSYSEGYVFQKHQPMMNFDGRYPVVQVWMVGDEAKAISLRESLNPVTDRSGVTVPWRQVI